MDVLHLVLPGGRSIRLDTERLRLGRDAACEIVLDDHSVSRRHATVEQRPEGWLVVDHESANGTFVDGQRIIQAFLRAGQELRLGTVVLRVTGPDAQAGTAQPKPKRSRPS
jgi:pSer/pThr/pTyr-binding forkhead associated (FHA) protein